MATWPIVRTQRTMPGTTGATRGSLDYPDMESSWKEFSNLWEGIGDEFKRRRLRRIADQVAEYKVRYTEEVGRFSEALAKNPDESTYPAEYEKFNNRVSSEEFMPKDSIAKSAARLHVRSKAPDHRKMIRVLQDAKLEDRWLAGYGGTMAAVKDGKENLNELKLKQMEGIALGYIKREQASDDFLKTKRVVQYNSWLDYSRTHPREVLKSLTYEDGKYRIGAIPEITKPGDAMVMKNIAIDAITEQERIKELLVTDNNREMAADATNLSITPKEQWNKISHLEISDEEKIAQFKKYTDNRNSIIKGLGSAFDTTADEVMRKSMMERARNKTLTHKEINDAEGKSISTPDADAMRKALEDKDDKSKSFQESEAGKNLTALIDDTIEDVPLNQFAQQKGLSILRSAIESNPDWTLREKTEESLRIGRRIEREYDDGILERELEDVIRPEKPEIFSKLKPSGFAKPKGITKAEFDKLPSGAIFIAPDGKRRRKP